MTSRILMIVTSNARMGDTGKPTGLWAEELAVPYYALADAGVEITLASPAGGPAPIDPGSLQPVGQNDPVVERFLADEAMQTRIAATPRALEFDGAEFDAGFAQLFESEETVFFAADDARSSNGNVVCTQPFQSPGGQLEQALITGQAEKLFGKSGARKWPESRPGAAAENHWLYWNSGLAHSQSTSVFNCAISECNASYSTIFRLRNFAVSFDFSAIPSGVSKYA